MTVIDAILKAKPSHEEGKYISPPPEVVDFDHDIKKKRVYKYAHVLARIDSSPPRYKPERNLHKFQDWLHQFRTLNLENIFLLMSIRRAQFEGTKRARATFVLFPPVPHEDMEDLAFKAAPDVKRPRVYLKLGLKDGAVMGEVCVELFTDKCPKTCRLFLELVDGDAYGHSYVNTCFFRKIPHMYWSGGDVIYNNGFGCYAQTGREIPIGAENFHYPHSMPGLLSMRVTADDEMCGIFNITFKPLPQLDLRSVVFGRVIRPSFLYNIIRGLGNALSSRPVVEIRSTRRKVEGRWISGKPNTRLAKRTLALAHGMT